MYKITLQVLVMNGINKESSSDWFYATIDTELPFPPFKNLYISMGTRNEWRGSWHILEVIWSMEKNTFICNCEDQVLDLINVEQIMYHNWLKLLPSWGWRIIPKDL